jgi:probable rRNA maturation factor
MPNLEIKGPEIEVEVEDPAWNAVPDVEAVVVRAAVAACALLDADPQSPFPLEGGRVGVGGVPTGRLEERDGAPAPSSDQPDTAARTPPANPPPSRRRAIVVLLASDGEVADLNQQFRHKPGPTNVLSFPAPQNPENLLGDIALAYGVCAREAAEQGKSLADHLSHLTVHGVLHLAGYDHQTDDEAQAMEDLERRVLASLGVSDPYDSEKTI